MKRFIILCSVATLAACSGGEDTNLTELTAINQALLDEGLAKMDSLDEATWKMFEGTFAAREKEVLDLKKKLEELDKRSPERAKLYKEFKEKNRQLVEDEMAFLGARKDALKTVYNRSSEMIAKLDGKLAEIDTTRRTPVVTAMTVGTEEFKDYFRVQGNLEASKNALVFPEMNGIVKSIAVKEGQKVSKGQALMVLDTEIVRKQIAEVETSLALANDLFIRQESLWNQNIGSEVQYLEAKNRKESLENTLATLREQQSMGTVRAPFAGTIDEITPKLGEMASPSMPVARVVNLSDIYVEADVSEKHFGKIGQGGEVLVSVQGMETAGEIPATITRVGTYIKPDNRTFKIRVDFNEKRTDLIPNLVAELKVNEFSTAGQAVVLPASMVLENASGDNYVWVLTPSNRPERMRVERRIIQTGPTYNSTTLITAGLNPGETIIDKGVRKVKNGELVQVEETAANASFGQR